MKLIMTQKLEPRIVSLKSTTIGYVEKVNTSVYKLCFTELYFSEKIENLLFRLTKIFRNEQDHKNSKLPSRAVQNFYFAIRGGWGAITWTSSW